MVASFVSTAPSCCCYIPFLSCKFRSCCTKLCLVFVLFFFFFEFRGTPSGVITWVWGEIHIKDENKRIVLELSKPAFLGLFAWVLLLELALMVIQRNVLSLSLQETHELIIHQVIVQVQGWAALSPVSVDRVGTFFRQARRQQVETTSMVRGSLEL